MKKLVIIFVSALTCFALAACGTSASSSSATAGSAASTTSASAESSASANVKVRYHDFGQDYESPDTYLFSFILLDENDKPIAPTGQADLNVVNNDGEEVYSGTFTVTSENYIVNTRSEYLGTISIPTGDIKITANGHGTCEARIRDESGAVVVAFTFGTEDLPVVGPGLYTADLPIEIKNTTGGDLKISGKITDIKGSFSAYRGYWDVDVYVSGEITEVAKDASGNSITVYYSLVDESGNPAGNAIGNSKTIVLRGEKTFADERFGKFRDLEPGKNYYLTIEPDKPR